ncbi:hypothetical protein KDI_05920 [Dictyobacter arantiisoli]|uniref:Uncharacterized protein n=1 Tax=Dictyobacter arantiisoli TaxID=2014874 RepID=A0A5A5T6N1_9CHLR|nr:hypothetical protein KDI_05920 [Dictyobacter arantiisoli]
MFEKEEIEEVFRFFLIYNVYVMNTGTAHSIMQEQRHMTLDTARLNTPIYQ